MDGARLRKLRKERGLNQNQLAQLAGINRGTVIAWEARPTFPSFAWAPSRMCAAMGVACCLNESTTRTRIKGSYSSSFIQKADQLAETQLVEFRERQSAREACKRVLCGAKTRKGRPCRAKSVPGKQRCKFHGGKSTGPRTPEGKARIAAAQKKRWATYRTGKEDVICCAIRAREGSNPAFGNEIKASSRLG